MRISYFDSGIEWRTAALDAILYSLSEAAQSGNFAIHLCLSGGSTPKPVYEALATSEEFFQILKRNEIVLWVGDEREVPVDSPYRNGTMIQDSFESAVERASADRGSKPLRLILWPALPAAQACPLYAASIESRMGKDGVFCCTVLGVGADGHTAGLFSPLDADRGDILAFPTRAPSYPENRMTLSAATLKRANHLLLLAKGADKADIVRDAAERRGDYPISRLDGDTLDAMYCSGKDCV